MVKNYRNINDDIRTLIRLAKIGLEKEYRETRFAHDPRPFITQFESDKEAIVRLESATKS